VAVERDGRRLLGGWGREVIRRRPTWRANEERELSSRRKEGHIPAGNGSLRLASSLRSSLEPGTVIKRDFPAGQVDWSNETAAAQAGNGGRYERGGGHEGILCAGLFAPLRRFGFFLFLFWSFLAALCVRSSLYFGLDPRRTLTVYTQAYRDHGENNCGGVKCFLGETSVSWLFRLTRSPRLCRAFIGFASLAVTRHALRNEEGTKNARCRDCHPVHCV
ncbi:hypothetical protein K0M31_015396, partial [Melipona bicolor]